jgi:hypothetical protein
MFQYLAITKLALISQINDHCKKLVAHVQFSKTFKLAPFYNTYMEIGAQLCTTTYWILAPSYKSIADIEDFG